MDKNTYESAARELYKMGCKRPARSRVSVEHAMMALALVWNIVVEGRASAAAGEVGRRWAAAWEDIAEKAARSELLTHVRPPSTYMDLETLREEYNKTTSLLGMEKYKSWPYCSHLSSMQMKYRCLIVNMEAALHATLDGRKATAGRSPKKVEKSEKSRLLRERMKGRKVSEDKGGRRH